jgi:hypothetical protein
MGIPLIKVYEQIFGIKKTNLQFYFGAGAQFIVSKYSSYFTDEYKRQQVLHKLTAKY